MTEYLSLRALAGYSGLSLSTIRRRMADPFNPIPTHRVGRRVLVRRTEFDAWLDAQRRNTRATIDEKLADLGRAYGLPFAAGRG